MRDIVLVVVNVGLIALGLLLVLLMVALLLLIVFCLVVRDSTARESQACERWRSRLTALAAQHATLAHRIISVGFSAFSGISSTLIPVKPLFRFAL